MALIKCKECGSEVSSKAEACPKCGVRIARKPMGFGGLIGVVILGVVITSVFPNIFSSGSKSGTLSAPSLTNSAPIGQKPLQAGSQWFYDNSGDSMSKGIIHIAGVLSSNTVNFGFPYAGAQHATLALRIHPRSGKSVIFRIEKGQILCQSYQDCIVLVRFDDEEPTNYSAVGAADNSTESIIIRNYDQFIEKMIKSKRVRIAVNIYQEGAPVFDFNVSDFDQEKYQSEK